ncbi:MAG: sensor histidine kinase [Gaiellales bacterium]
MPSSTDDRDQAELFDRMLASMDADRAAIAHQLHDGPQQTLTAVRLMVNAAQNAIRSNDRERTEQVLAKLDVLASEAAQELRRLTARLYPVVIARQGGLVPALQALAQSTSDEYGVAVTFDPPEGGWDGEDTRDTAIYQVAHEAAVNAARHGRPPVEIRLSAGPHGIVMQVDDSGGRLTDGEGIGMRVMRDRAARLGGRLDIRTEPGLLTSVVLRVPAQPP